jgi:hypothetical protein
MQKSAREARQGAETGEEDSTIARRCRQPVDIVRAIILQLDINSFFMALLLFLIPRKCEWQPEVEREGVSARIKAKLRVHVDGT